MKKDAPSCTAMRSARAWKNFLSWWLGAAGLERNLCMQCPSADTAALSFLISFLVCGNWYDLLHGGGPANIFAPRWMNCLHLHCVFDELAQLFPPVLLTSVDVSWCAVQLPYGDGWKNRKLSPKTWISKCHQVLEARAKVANEPKWLQEYYI